MELFLLKSYFFLRPIMLMEVFYFKIKGINVFSIFGVSCFFLLYIFFLKRILFKTLQIDPTDIFVFVNILWISFVFCLHYKHSSIKSFSQLLIPLFSFSVIKHVVEDTNQYLSLLFYFIIAMAIPISYSFFLIIQGKGVAQLLYWINVIRYKGAYLNSHNCGHSMTLFLIISIIMYEICKVSQNKDFFCFRNFSLKISLYFFVTLSLFCLYKSHVRTAYIGLIIFLLVYLFYYKKSYFLLVIVLLSAIFIYKISFLKKEFYDVSMVLEHKWSKDSLGSGRIFIWKTTLSYFLYQDLSKLLSGLGVGKYLVSKHISDSHSDFLEILIETGFIGLFLYLSIQFLILKKILTISTSERNVFLAFFIAVSVMNFISNSYITRFAFSQMYYLIMCYPYIKEKQKVK